MSTKNKALSDCGSGHEMLQVLDRHQDTHGFTIEAGGRHMKVKNSRGTVAIPDHRGDLPKGTKHGIIKQLAAIGIVLTLAAVLVVVMHVI